MTVIKTGGLPGLRDPAETTTARSRDSEAHGEAFFFFREGENYQGDDRVPQHCNVNRTVPILQWIINI